MFPDGSHGAKQINYLAVISRVGFGVRSLAVKYATAYTPDD
jgi:hypothetical protein